MIADTVVVARPNVGAARERNHTADALRGLAALAVCWFHFTHGNAAFLPEGLRHDGGDAEDFL